MSRYIDTDMIEYEPMCRARGNGMYEDCEIAYKDQIDDISTSDVRENVKGRWIRHPEQKNIYGGKCVECSECGEKYMVQYVEDEKFCRNCGAEMRGKYAGSD